MQHSEKRLAIERAKEQFADAVTGEQWLAINVRIDENGVAHYQRTTWRFPVDRLPEVLSNLRQQFAEEVMPLDTSPLPKADLKIHDDEP